MGYVQLDSETSALVGNIEKESGPAIFELACGEPYEAGEGELPFRFSYRYPQGARLPDFSSGDCLMNQRLVSALRAAGVDNLQVFPAVLKDAQSGEERGDYCVVNVIGLVAAADMQNSEALGLAGGQVFSKLAVDEKKAHELLAFRLAESLMDIIVHESVAEAVRGGGFHGVSLKPVS